MILDYLKILRLDYLTLDRPLTSLSGGERQRLYILSLLNKRIKNTLIVFENLSGGLSELELNPISELLHKLCESSNTIVIIDQNMYFKDVSHNHIDFDEL